jgi:hypothetical protein
MRFIGAIRHPIDPAPPEADIPAQADDWQDVQVAVDPAPRHAKNGSDLFRRQKCVINVFSPEQTILLRGLGNDSGHWHKASPVGKIGIGVCRLGTSCSEQMNSSNAC